MTISTGNIFTILDRLDNVLGFRMYRVTLGDRSVSHIVGASLKDARQRVREINSRAVILGIQETHHAHF